MWRIWILITKGRAENNKLTAALYFVVYKNMLTVGCTGSGGGD